MLCQNVQALTVAYGILVSKTGEQDINSGAECHRWTTLDLFVSCIIVNLFNLQPKLTLQNQDGNLPSDFRQVAMTFFLEKED